MGAGVNSESGEICPSISPDGKLLFFTSRRRGKADIFWIKADIIIEIKRKIKIN
jgi:Tol biopolymer transport system component